MKTLEQWHESRQNLDSFLQVGDVVDEPMMYYFLEVLPPAFYNSRIVQIGEPYSHVRGRETFSTVAKNSHGEWVYCGNCWRGECVEPALPPQSPQCA